MARFEWHRGGSKKKTIEQVLRVNAGAQPELARFFALVCPDGRYSSKMPVFLDVLVPTPLRRNHWHLAPKMWGAVKARAMCQLSSTFVPPRRQAWQRSAC